MQFHNGLLQKTAMFGQQVFRQKQMLVNTTFITTSRATTTIMILMCIVLTAQQLLKDIQSLSLQQLLIRHTTLPMKLKFQLAQSMLLVMNKYNSVVRRQLSRASTLEMTFLLISTIQSFKSQLLVQDRRLKITTSPMILTT